MSAYKNDIQWSKTSVKNIPVPIKRWMCVVCGFQIFFFSLFAFLFMRCVGHVRCGGGGGHLNV